MPLHARGADRFWQVARALRQADASMTKHLRRRMTDAVTPMQAVVRRRVPQYVPDAYAAVLAPALQFRTSTRVTASTVSVGVTVTADGAREQRALGDIDNGRLRHPLYGLREHWFTTTVKPGVVSQSMDDEYPTVRRAIEQAVDDTLRELGRD